jgi:hypothetical protein
MPNNPNNARSLLNLIKPPASTTPASQAATPALSAEESRVQKAYDALGISPPVGTPQNPVRMQAGGVIGNIGMLNAVRMGIKPRLTPEQEAYMDQYNTYADQYNNSYGPAYEQYVAQQNAWAEAYNKAQSELESGKYDVKVKNTKVKPYFDQGYYTYTTKGSDQILRPRNLSMVFSDPEPVFSQAEPNPPALPEGYTDAEQYQQAVSTQAQQAAKRKNLGLAAFSNPQGYNLAGFGGAATFKDGGEVDKEETEVVLSKKELLDRLIEKQALQNLISEMSSVRVDPSLIAGTFEDKNAKGRYYDVGADISLGDKLGIGASGRGTSVKFDGGGFKENILSQLRGRYNTDDGIQYSAEYSPVGTPGQLDPTQRAYRLSRRNLADQSEISLSREPGRMGMDIPGQAPEPGTTDTTWLRYAKEFNKGGDVKKSARPFGKGEPAKKVEGSPYNKDGAPITAQGPSAGEVAAFINSFIPGTGDVQSAAEGYQAFKDKDYLGAGLGAAGALPLVPNTTKYVRGSISELLNKIKKERGDYMARRVERAADEVPNLENQYTSQTLSSAFGEGNPQALMILDPKNFEEYAKPLPPGLTGTKSKYSGRSNEYGEPLNYDEYIDYLAKSAREHGLYEVPFLSLSKADKGGVRISGHEGRHRTRALAKLGDKSTLVRLLPDYDLTSSEARRYKEDYIEELKARLGLDPTVQPEAFSDVNLPMPDVFKNGGEVNGSKLDPVYVETAALRSQIEKDIPKDKYFETYPVKMVNALKTDRSELAGVTYPYKEPSFININPKSTFGGKYGTFEHERQHLIDAKRGKTELRYPAPEYVVEDAKYDSEKKFLAADKDLQFKTMNDINLAYQKHRKELGLSEDFTTSGFFAEIRRIEKALPVGKSILETNIGKDLFANNPELLQTYWSRTRPQFTTYMTEQRDSPRYKMENRTDVYKETPSKSKKGTLEKVQDFIRNKTAGYRDGGDVKKSEGPSEGNTGFAWPTWRDAKVSPESYQDSYVGDIKSFLKKTPENTGRYMDTDLLKSIGVFEPKIKNGFKQEGMYTSRNPDMIWVSPKNSLYTTDTVAHEYQHLLNQRRKDNKDFFDYYEKNPEKRKAAQELLSQIESKYGPGGWGESDMHYNLSSDFLDLDEGFLATLKGIEARLPVGKSIYDTKLGKELFNKNPELKNYFMINTRPTKGTYMSNPTPTTKYNDKTDEKGTLTKLQDFIRAKTVN